MRLSDWDTRLAEYIASKRHEPFAYGKNDCCYFCFGAVIAATGEDRMAEFRGKYRTLAGSLRALRDIGAGDLESTMNAKFDPMPVSHARRGDIVLFDGSIGIVAGSFAWFVSDDGLERVPREYWEKAWANG